MKKYIFYGGSFNPIHNGHIAVANAVLNEIDNSVIYFSPVINHPWSKNLIPIYNRLEMMYTIAEDNEKFKLCPDPFKYTINFIKDIFTSKEFNRYNTYYLIGMDQAELIEEWAEWKELLNIIPFIVVNRYGITHTNTWCMKDPHKLIYMKDVPISSSEIRPSPLNIFINLMICSTFFST